MAVHIAGNLKELIDDSAAGYINLNVDKFKSTTPGPVGPDGPVGPRGEGVHHMKGTSTTDPEGDFSTAGELDTYTFYADADELFPLAWFTVKNGEDPWLRAIDRGYRGTEEEFYTLLASVEEYATIALESIDITEENKQIVLAAATQVATDKIVVEDARDIAVEKSEIAKESADAVQIIFLGTKSVDPVVDNQGNPLVVGVMYYNEVIGQLKLWNGTEWTTAAFSAGGAVISFNGRNGAISLTNSDITIAVGRNVANALNTIDLAIASEVSKTNSHIADISNPHNVTKDQVGLGNVNNTSDINKPISTATQTALNLKVDKASKQSLDSNSALRVAGTTVSLYKGDGTFDSITTQDTIYTLPTATSTAKGGIVIFSDTVQTVASNTVSTTAGRTYGIQLNSEGQAVVNVPWSNTVYTHPNSGVTAGTYSKVTVNTQGHITAGSSLSASDIPSLDASKITSGTIDAARLPSFVDDVLEFANLAGFPATGESGKIYIALDTNKAYRWSGSVYVYITSGSVDSVNGRAGLVEIVNNDITLAVGKDLTDAIKYSEADKVLTDVNKVSLSTDTSLAAGVGQITWNPNERTADIGLDNNVVLQVGQETVALVRNGTVSTIANGTVVMLTGSVGNSSRLVVAPYDGVADASLILGIATETIASGADGFVTSYGKIRGINTSMWNDGDVLYTNGSGLGITPTSSLSMKIAAVVHSHTNGTLMVRVNGYSQVKEW